MLEVDYFLETDIKWPASTLTQKKSDLYLEETISSLEEKTLVLQNNFKKYLVIITCVYFFHTYLSLCNGQVVGMVFISKATISKAHMITYYGFQILQYLMKVHIVQMYYSSTQRAITDKMSFSKRTSLFLLKPSFKNRRMFPISEVVVVMYCMVISISIY